jgi:signal peptidase I
MNVKRKHSTTLYLGVLAILLVAFALFILLFTRRVSGVSMRPTLEEGDLVAIENVPISQVHVGDIIVFNSPYFGGCSDFTIIHRVVQIASDGGLITQGDNRATNPGPDEAQGGPYVTQQCLVGKVVFVLPYFERIAELFPYPTNYLLALLIVFYVIYSEFGPRRNKTASGPSQTSFLRNLETIRVLQPSPSP